MKNRMERKAIDRMLVEIRKQTRVCIFIDNPALLHALRRIDRYRRPDYERFREFLADGRTSDIRFYYSVPPPCKSFDKEGQKQRAKLDLFIDELEKIGYTVVGLPMRYEGNGEGEDHCRREKGLNCDIVYDMAVLAERGNYQAFVLVSGDDDFARTVRRIRNELGVPIEVAFFSHLGCSQLLIKEATRFIDLSPEIDKLWRESQIAAASV